MLWDVHSLQDEYDRNGGTLALSNSWCLFGQLVPHETSVDPEAQGLESRNLPRFLRRQRISAWRVGRGQN